ncbi:O-antigen ligase family protein [Halorhabdus amylolytica]|uniref:O-antigen ligase family protein n=1 Tax=Halorhabdus amylolytica TaxID=2559573 RepID=UPI00145B4EE3|nr:hypothetical protein [Halorhabdus amylolytica]
MPTNPSRIERALLLFATAASPLFFVQLAGKNLAPWTVFFPIVVLLYAVRTNTIIVGPTTRYLLGLLIFCLAITLSTVNSPFPLESLLDSGQYYIILLMVMPACLLGFRDLTTRWWVVLILVLSLNSISVIGEVVAIINGSLVVELAYGNHNLIPMLTGAAAILNFGLVFSNNFNDECRKLLAMLSTVHLFTVFLGPSNGAKVMLVIAAWLFGWWMVERSRYPSRFYGLVSVVAGCIGLYGIYAFWEKIYEAAFYHRIPMYYEALIDGIRTFPLGGGMSSANVYLADLPIGISREVHNIWLSHWLEFGVLGVAGSVLLFLDWPILFTRVIHSRSDDLAGWEFGTAVLFGAWFVQVQFQPAPVTRFWWIVFALSWTVLLDHHPDRLALSSQVTLDGSSVPLSTVWQSSRVTSAWVTLKETMWAVSQRVSSVTVCREDEPITLDQIGKAFTTPWRHSLLRDLVRLLLSDSGSNTK